MREKENNDRGEGTVTQQYVQSIERKLCEE